MRSLNQILHNHIIDKTKLNEFGFINNVYKRKINDNFEVVIDLNKFKSYVKDLISYEEYIMVDVKTSTGEYVGRIRESYENTLKDFIDKCTTYQAYKSSQSKEIINYVKDKYNDELEFLWNDDNSVLRNKTNNKWYAAILKVKGIKVGLTTEELIEVIDLRYDKDNIDSIIDNINILPGYHMNKKSWITIRLDNTVDITKIIEFIDNSYNLSLKK